MPSNKVDRVNIRGVLAPPPPNKQMALPRLSLVLSEPLKMGVGTGDGCAVIWPTFAPVCSVKGLRCAFCTSDVFEDKF